MGVTLPNQYRSDDRHCSASSSTVMNLSNVGYGLKPTVPYLDDSSTGAIAEQMRQCFQTLKTQMPNSPELAHLQSYLAQFNWFSTFHQTSQLLIAVIDPLNLTLQYANHYCCQMLGMNPATNPTQTETPQHLRDILKQRLSKQDYGSVLRLYRRLIFHFILQSLYNVDPSYCRLLETPVMVALPSPYHVEPRYIEFWLRAGNLHITRLDPEMDEFADLHLADLSPEEWELKLTDPQQLDELEQRFCLTNYQVEGQVLLEGLDVTVRETIHRITQLLIDRDSILQPQKFRQVNQQLRSLFRTDNTIILTIEQDEIRVFMGSVQHDMDATTYPLELLQDSPVMKALQANQVLTIRDLSRHSQTELGRQLAQKGVRSLLLIPLLSQAVASSTDTALPEKLSSTQVMGLVGLMSDRPSHFDGLDVCHAKQLIPAFARALTSAQRQLMHQRFINNIHPAVEWRFLQEAERRSLGLPAEPIVFDHVYPLYGISDIRGSSEARNHAIQTDLLTQFQLAVAVVEAVCQAKDSALTHQLQQDLQERMEQLREKVTVDAEVTEIRYLRNHLESYFDYFAQCGPDAIAAIEAYRAACNNEHNCVYAARAEYDQAIGQINTALKETWETWQQRMQQITPHYCDIETTDGIDHMIYTGQSIDPNFGKFQLRSLRYEQLRAVCDCARVAMRLQTETQSKMQVTHLVLVQDSTVDIFHDETTEKLFDVRGTRDTRYEIVKKRIDKAIDEQTAARITQPGMVTLVYSTTEELEEYQQYLHYLTREGLIDTECDRGTVEPLQGVTGLKFIRVRVRPIDPL